MNTSITRLLVSGILLTAALAHGGSVPGEMNYQGQILTATGTPLTTGNYTITFTIYDAPDGGSAVWGPHTNAAVAVVDGSFNVVLPATDSSSRSLLEAAAESPRFLGVKVGTNPEISPRQQLLSAPYALNAEQLQGAGWDAVFDNGDPTTGKIPGASIANASITSGQIANNAVTAAKILDGQVGTADLADNAVTSVKILNGTIGNSDLANNAVTSAKILDGTITSADIFDGTITANDLANASIATEDLADGAVTSAKIADGTIQQADLGTVYRLSASDGNPATALSADSSGKVTANHGVGASYFETTGDLHLYKFLYPSPNVDVYLSCKNVGTFSPISALELDCERLIVTNLASGSGNPMYWDPASKHVRQLSSSRRYKEQIKPLTDDFSKILALEPKQYVRKENPGVVEFGYIAEEAEEAGLRAFTSHDAQGRPEGIDYARLIIYSNEILKDQQRRLLSQEQEIQSLKDQIEALKSVVQELGQSLK